jgi:glycosyltransferase involved in cell wall biosynthesis
MAQIIRDYKGGWVIEPNATALLQFLEHLDPLQARQLRHGLLNRVADLRWENEASVLLDVYERLLA